MTGLPPRRPGTVGLPMYDPPELHPTVDAWWRGLARAFRAEGVGEVPDTLDRTLSLDALWSAPDLVLTQTCGYPLLKHWADRLEYLATPCYAAPGCEGANYCSWIVVGTDTRAQRLEDLRGARCSINGRNSHSGYNALRGLVAPLAQGGRFFGSVSVSGGHAESIAQLGRGEVDVATIDCVTYALLRRCRPAAIAATRVIGRTPSAPGLPYAVRLGAGAERKARLLAGLARAFDDAALDTVRADLLLTGFEVLAADHYRGMIAIERQADEARYFELG